MIRRIMIGASTLALLTGCNIEGVEGLPDGGAFIGSKEAATTAVSSASTLSLGRWHACWALPNDGRLTCWGSDVSDVLGNGALAADQASANFVDTRAMPKGLDTTWRHVSAGRSHTCGVTSEGDAYCWSGGGAAALGAGTLRGNAPVAVDVSALPAGTTWSSITAGLVDHTCAITATGVGYCWGNPRNGKMGDGQNVAPSVGTPKPIDVSALPAGMEWAALSAGEQHTCGITTAGTAYCFGIDVDGRIGDGPATTTPKLRPVPVDISQLPAGTAWSAISAGWTFTCGITTSGAAYCWGRGVSGQLGNGGLISVDRPSPVNMAALPEGTTWAGIRAGRDHTCGITTAGVAYCWGSNLAGQLGHGGGPEAQSSPVAVDTGALEEEPTWVEIGTGELSSCGRTAAGEAYCWGSDDNGRLGNGGPTGNRNRPEVAVQAGLSVLLEGTSFAGAVGDPANPGMPITVLSTTGSTQEVVITGVSSNEAVVPSSQVVAKGIGRVRTLFFSPLGMGTSTITFTAARPNGQQVQFPVDYAASAPAPASSGRYHGAISDASTALDVGDGYMLVGNDETNTLFLFKQKQSGLPVKVWNFPAEAELGTRELDIEGAARSGDTIVWTSSHANGRTGGSEERRRVLFATKISGTGANVELELSGRYGGGAGTKEEVGARGIWAELIAWDQADGHGLGADALGFYAASQPGVLPNAPGGFNIEGFEFASDGTTGLLGFRGPTVGGSHGALIVPVTNVLELVDGFGTQSGRAKFGEPIVLDLGGRSIRELRRNGSGQYLISAGPPDDATPGVNDTWALYLWDGDPKGSAVLSLELPAPDMATGGVWESIASIPSPLVSCSSVRLLTDSGDTVFYGTNATKDLPPGQQKSYSQLFKLK